MKNVSANTEEKISQFQQTAFSERSDSPRWLSEKGKINEALFCDSFLQRSSLRYMNGSFFSTQGEVDEKDISAYIFNAIRPHVQNGLARQTENIMSALRLQCYCKDIITPPDEIHVRNGIIKTDGTWLSEMRFCTHRLGVTFDTEVYGGDHQPAVFLRFLSEMLDTDDIKTLQEYMGYCLIPVTDAQKAFFLIGNGGEGKSCIGVVMKSIFDKSMVTGNFHALETDRFARYKLLNRLVMIDDDIRMAALPSTGTIKNLITAKIPVEVEAKGKQSEQALLYSRFVCFGNGSPRALYDKSDAFTRRLIVLSANPVPKDRIPDTTITDRLIAEKDRIFMWAFDGLRRLIGNRYIFTLSDKTKRNIADMASENCNIAEFLADEDYISFGNGLEASSNRLYGGYSLWCSANGLTQLKQETFTNWLKNNAGKYGIEYSFNIRIEGKRVRGFKGIRTSYTPIVM